MVAGYFKWKWRYTLSGGFIIDDGCRCRCRCSYSYSKICVWVSPTYPPTQQHAHAHPLKIFFCYVWILSRLWCWLWETHDSWALHGVMKMETNTNDSLSRKHPPSLLPSPFTVSFLFLPSFSLILQFPPLGTNLHPHPFCWLEPSSALWWVRVTNQAPHSLNNLRHCHIRWVKIWDALRVKINM